MASKEDETLIIGPASPAPDPNKIDFAKVMSTAAGFGIVSGSFGGLVGALLGSVVGTGFGYWLQASDDKTKNNSPKAASVK